MGCPRSVLHLPLSAQHLGQCSFYWKYWLNCIEGKWVRLRHWHEGPGQSRSHRKYLRGNVGLASWRGQKTWEGQANGHAGVYTFHVRCRWKRVLFDRPQERNQPSGSLKEISHRRKNLGIDKNIQPPQGLVQEGLGSASGEQTPFQRLFFATQPHPQPPVKGHLSPIVPGSLWKYRRDQKEALCLCKSALASFCLCLGH